MPDTWDVAVAGGGPAGSATALLLARRGFRVVLFDRARFPRPKTCAEYMSPGVARLLPEIALADALAEAGARLVPGMDIISPSGSRFRVQYVGLHGPEHALTLARKHLDHFLLKKAVEAGVTVEEGVTVKGPLLEDHVVRGVQVSSNGRTHAVSAQVTVAADGAHSILAKRVGASAGARWPRRLGLVQHLEGPAHFPDGCGQMYVGRNGYCGVAPLPRGQVNVAVVVPDGASRAAGQSPAEFFRWWLDRDPAISRCLDGCRPISSVRGVAPVGIRARSVGVPGNILVGDAAGFFDPFTGEGIYRAIRGAEIAVDAVSAVLEDGRPWTSVLSEYQKSRRTEFRWKQGLTALVQLFVQFPSLLEYALPRLAAREAPATLLGASLGDLVDSRRFLRPSVLAQALRP